MMRRYLAMLVLGLGAQALTAQPGLAQAAAEITLTRMECGSRLAPTEVNLRFSDTFAYGGLKLQFVYSCYLIKHGGDYMMWDTSQALDAGPAAPKVSDIDLLAQLNVKPEQVKFVGISHFHGDHIGQVNSFPKATLLIGQRDWDVLTSKSPPPNAKPALVSNWISGGGKVETVAQDKDVFGDGTVVMLNTPGHTPGHHSLLVRLAGKGPVILSGDAVHFQENYARDGVPWFNFDRSQTVASIERIKQIASNLKAEIVIQHDARDVEKLPIFPASAK
ncbi:MAG TPA: N-acyl homoserine lactonase family protein [Hyphomicrobiaceae bacterium]|jgi:glyoxylase-like metal-dependent hydrolase (beta-lactamase superfamily II)